MPPAAPSRASDAPGSCWVKLVWPMIKRAAWPVMKSAARVTPAHSEKRAQYFSIEKDESGLFFSITAYGRGGTLAGCGPGSAALLYVAEVDIRFRAELTVVAEFDLVARAVS